MAAILLALLLLAVCSLIAHRKMKRVVDSREPLYVYPRIPLLGHFVGLLRRGPDYLVETWYGQSSPHLPSTNPSQVQKITLGSTQFRF